MEYSLRLQDFENISSETISLKLLTQDHVNELTTTTATAEEIIMTLNAGIQLPDLLDQTSGKNQAGGKIPSRIFLAVLLESQLVGIVAVEYSDMSKISKLRPLLKLKSVWYINSIWIRNNYSGKGIGFKVVQLICDHLKKLNPVEIRVIINTNNKTSRRVFEKAGFETCFIEQGSKGANHAHCALK